MINKSFPNQDLLVISIVWSPASLVYDHLAKRLTEISSASYEAHQGVFTVDDAFVGIPPAGAAHKKRIVAFSPQPDRITFFTTNSQDGWNSLAYRMTAVMDTKAIILRFCSDQVDYPARSFSWIVRGKLTRAVTASMEDTWLFCEQGTPLEQEDAAMYKRRWIRERLSNDYLFKLAMRLGVPFTDTKRPVGAGMLFLQQ